MPQPGGQEPEPTRECYECTVTLSGDALTEMFVRNLLESNGLANARDIQKIEITEHLSQATITLFDAQVAGGINSRRTIEYRGKTIRVVGKSFSYIMSVDPERQRLRNR